MGSMSLMHWLVVAVIVLILFGGRGKISELMGDLAKGIKSFRKGLQDEPAKSEADKKDAAALEVQGQPGQKPAAGAAADPAKAGQQPATPVAH